MFYEKTVEQKSYHFLIAFDKKEDELVPFTEMQFSNDVLKQLLESPYIRFTKKGFIFEITGLKLFLKQDLFDQESEKMQQYFNELRQTIEADITAVEPWKCPICGYTEEYDIRQHGSSFVQSHIDIGEYVKLKGCKKCHNVRFVYI